MKRGTPTISQDTPAPGERGTKEIAAPGNLLLEFGDELAAVVPVVGIELGVFCPGGSDSRPLLRVFSSGSERPGWDTWITVFQILNHVAV